MTVRSIGPDWLRRVLDRNQVVLHRRVVAVALEGKQFDDQALATVSQFQQLQRLQLSDTSIQITTLAEWQVSHPDVEVYVSNSLIGP